MSHNLADLPELKSKLGLDLYLQEHGLKEFDPPKVELHSAWIVVLMMVGLGAFGVFMSGADDLLWPALLGSFLFSLIFAIPYLVEGWRRTKAPQFEIRLQPSIPELGDDLKISWDRVAGDQPHSLEVSLHCEQWYFPLPIGRVAKPYSDSLVVMTVAEYTATAAQEVPLLGQFKTKLPDQLCPSVLQEALSKATLPQLPPFWMLEFSGRCGITRRKFSRRYLVPKYQRESSTSDNRV